MASATSAGIAKMIVQYEWILEDVEKEKMTIASKMILFRGERIFRVGLKNHVSWPVLFFIAIDINKMGMRVKEVMYGIQDSGIGTTTMTQMKQEEISDGSLQLFNVNLKKQVTGNCTFVFRICIEGSVPGFSYRLADRLAKDQLWDSQNWTDVEFVVKGKTFFAHKAILAARSPVFANEFAKKQPLTNDPQQIRIDYIEPSTVEQFLHFIYTGEPMGTFANEELLKLADEYRLTTLTSLCKVALEKIKPIQMVSLANNLSKVDKISSSQIRPEKETEIFFDRTMTTFRCAFPIKNPSNNRSPLISVMQYQNEDVFFADLTGSYDDIFMIEAHFLSTALSKFGLKVEDIYFGAGGIWYKMKSKNLQKNVELQRFIAQRSPTLPYLTFNSVYFDIKIISTIDNYYYEMMDDDWMTDFWRAAKNQKFTDVEIFVGAVKLMEAHQVILSVRSPVLNAAFNGKPIPDKIKFTFEAEFDVDIVKLFLQFLYTGSLETSAVHKQLLKLATIFEVETLKNICQLANRAPPDVEALTNSLLEL